MESVSIKTMNARSLIAPPGSWDRRWRRGRSGGGLSLAAPAGCHDPRQGARQGRERPGVVDLLVAPARQPSLGALTGALGSGAVDLVGPLRGVREHDDLVVPNLREAARHGQVVLVAPDAIHELADPQRRQKGRVPR